MKKIRSIHDERIFFTRILSPFLILGLILTPQSAFDRHGAGLTSAGNGAASDSRSQALRPSLSDATKAGMEDAFEREGNGRDFLKDTLPALRKTTRQFLNVKKVEMVRAIYVNALISPQGVLGGDHVQTASFHPVRRQNGGYELGSPAWAADGKPLPDSWGKAQGNAAEALSSPERELLKPDRSYLVLTDDREEPWALVIFNDLNGKDEHYRRHVRKVAETLGRQAHFAFQNVVAYDFADMEEKTDRFIEAVHDFKNKIQVSTRSVTLVQLRSSRLKQWAEEVLKMGDDLASISERIEAISRRRYQWLRQGQFSESSPLQIERDIPSTWEELLYQASLSFLQVLKKEKPEEAWEVEEKYLEKAQSLPGQDPNRLGDLEKILSDWKELVYSAISAREVLRDQDLEIDARFERLSQQYERLATSLPNIWLTVNEESPETVELIRSVLDGCAEAGEMLERVQALLGKSSTASPHIAVLEPNRNLKEVLERKLTSLALFIHSRNVWGFQHKLSYDLSAVGGDAQADPDDVRLINSAFENLITNAYKYRDKEMGKSLQVTVEAAYDPQSRRFEGRVVDNGLGFTEQEKAGWLFGERGGAKKQMEQGSGVGMGALYRRLMQRGGNLWIQATQPGEGSDIRFSLPLLQLTQAARTSSRNYDLNAPLNTSQDRFARNLEEKFGLSWDYFTQVGESAAAEKEQERGDSPATAGAEEVPGWNKEIENLVQAVKVGNSGGIVLHLGGHLGQGDDDHFLKFIDRMRERGVEPVVLLERGPPFYKELQQLISRDATVGASLYLKQAFPFPARIVDPLVNYYLSEKEAPLPLEKLIPQADHPLLSLMFERLSLLWQQDVADLIAQKRIYITRELEKRNVPFVYEQSPLSSWILCAAADFQEHQAQEALFLRNDEPELIESFRWMVDLNLWKDKERDFAVAAQGADLAKDRPGRLIVIRAGYLHEALKERVEAALSSAAQTMPVAVATSFSEPDASYQQMMLDRRLQSRAGQPLNGRERLAALKYGASLLLSGDFFKNSPNVRSSADFIRLVRGLLEPMSEPDLRELNRSLSDLTVRRAWPRADRLPNEWVKLAKTFFMLAKLRSVGLLPQTTVDFLPPDMKDIQLSNWEALLEKRLKNYETGPSAAGAEEGPADQGWLSFVRWLPCKLPADAQEKIDQLLKRDPEIRQMLEKSISAERPLYLFYDDKSEGASSTVVGNEMNKWLQDLHETEASSEIRPIIRFGRDLLSDSKERARMSLRHEAGHIALLVAGVQKGTEALVLEQALQEAKGIDPRMAPQLVNALGDQEVLRFQKERGLIGSVWDYAEWVLFIARDGEKIISKLKDKKWANSVRRFRYGLDLIRFWPVKDLRQSSDDAEDIAGRLSSAYAVSLSPKELQAVFDLVQEIFEPTLSDRRWADPMTFRLSAIDFADRLPFRPSPGAGAEESGRIQLNLHPHYSVSEFVSPILVRLKASEQNTGPKFVVIEHSYPPLTFLEAKYPDMAQQIEAHINDPLFEQSELASALKSIFAKASQSMEEMLRFFHENPKQRNEPHYRQILDSSPHILYLLDHPEVTAFFEKSPWEAFVANLRSEVATKEAWWALIAQRNREEFLRLETESYQFLRSAASTRDRAVLNDLVRPLMPILAKEQNAQLNLVFGTAHIELAEGIPDLLAEYGIAPSELTVKREQLPEAYLRALPENPGFRRKRLQGMPERLLERVLEKGKQVTRRQVSEIAQAIFDAFSEQELDDLIDAFQDRHAEFWLAAHGSKEIWEYLLEKYMVAWLNERGKLASIQEYFHYEHYGLTVARVLEEVRIRSGAAGAEENPLDSVAPRVPMTGWVTQGLTVRATGQYVGDPLAAGLEAGQSAIVVPAAGHPSVKILAVSGKIKELQAGLEDAGILVRRYETPEQTRAGISQELPQLLVVTPEDFARGGWESLGVPTAVIPAAVAAGLEQAELAVIAAAAGAHGILHINDLTRSGAEEQDSFVVLQMT